MGKFGPGEVRVANAGCGGSLGLPAASGGPEQGPRALGTAGAVTGNLQLCIAWRSTRRRAGPGRAGERATPEVTRDSESPEVPEAGGPAGLGNLPIDVGQTYVNRPGLAD
jgi:hypothetical protein